MAETGAKDARLDSLTGLRFVAAFAVLIDHSTAFIPGAPFVTSPFGVEGIAFFFLLSGFVLTWSRSSRKLGQYARRRFARIYPIYLLAVLSSFLVVAFFARVGARDMLASQNLGQTLRLVTMTQMWVPGQLNSGVDGPTWTLSIEFFFYLMFPLLVAGAGRLSRTQRRLLAIALIVGEVIGYVALEHLNVDPSPTAYWLTNVMPPLRMVEFLLGILAALEIRDGARVPLSLALPLTGATQWWEWHSRTGHGIVPAFAPAPVLLPMVLLVMAFASADLNGRRTVLNNRVVVKLGSWSYALYLFHYLVFIVFFRPHFITWPSFIAGHFWRLFVIEAGSAIAVSGIVYEIFERPTERWIRRGPRATRLGRVELAASTVSVD